MGKKKDWQKIRDEYVYGNDTVNYTTLSKKYSEVYRSLYNRATQDKWHDHRMKFRLERDEHAKQEIILRHSNELLKTADFFMILRGALAQFLEKKTKAGQVGTLTLDEVEQVTKCLAENVKATKLVIGEHTGILKVDENLTYQDLINQKKAERGLPEGNGKSAVKDMSVSSKVDTLQKVIVNNVKGNKGNGKGIVKQSFLNRLKDKDT